MFKIEGSQPIVAHDLEIQDQLTEQEQAFNTAARQRAEYIAEEAVMQIVESVTEKDIYLI